MLLSAVAAVLLAVPPAHRIRAIETWQVDPGHSEVAFRIRHFMSKVPGRFDTWSGTVTVDPADWSSAQVSVEIRTASIDTQNERRDAHLRSTDFFAADSFPTITFRSTKVARRGKDGLVLDGLLTMKGVTRPVTLTGTLVGMQRDAQGKQRAGLEAQGVIDRTAWGVTWNKTVEGAAMLGDEVEIEVTLELVKQEHLGTR